MESINASDEILPEMLLQAFNDNTNKLTLYLNDTQIIQFVRQYTNVISSLSYIKLEQSQWNWYRHIGMR